MKFNYLTLFSFDKTRVHLAFVSILILYNLITRPHPRVAPPFRIVLVVDHPRGGGSLVRVHSYVIYLDTW
jgi:hypothetical protein